MADFRHDSGANVPPAYIDGHFSQRLKAGDRPEYGYPKNHLPEAKMEKMKVETGFMAARRTND